MLLAYSVDHFLHFYEAHWCLSSRAFTVQQDLHLIICIIFCTNKTFEYLGFCWDEKENFNHKRCGCMIQWPLFHFHTTRFQKISGLVSRNGRRSIVILRLNEHQCLKISIVGVACMNIINDILKMQLVKKPYSGVKCNMNSVKHSLRCGIKVGCINWAGTFQENSTRP